VDEGGVAVSLRGNPDHPFSVGELCPKVNRYLDRVYHPDRILTPLIRTGPKGSGEFREATWPEALEFAATELRRVIDTYGGEAVVPYSSAGTQGLIQMSSLDRRFFAHLGATRMTGSVCGATAGAGMSLAYGLPLGAEPVDLEHSKYVILWGTNTRLTNRHLWPFVEKARERGAKIVVIDPVRTMTAESADWFIQPLPGTDIALMLAMMNVIIAEGLVDTDFVAEHTTGFEQLVDHVADWSPVRAGGVCGLEPEVIIQLAREYATTRPAFIRTLIGAEHSRDGASFFRTISLLPMLIGSWRERGGGVARSIGSWSAPFLNDSVFDPSSRPKTRSLPEVQLGQHLTDPELGIHALMVWNANPVISLPNAGAIRRGLERSDLFCVVSEQFMTDTARYADVVFPATTQIEHLDVVGSWGHVNIGWNEPAIEPQGESVANTELFRRLAAAMGITDELFDCSDEQLIERAVCGIDTAELRERGWVRPDLPSPLRPDRDGTFPTATGKVAFDDPALEKIGISRLPTYSPPPIPDLDGEAFVLLTPKRHTRFLNSTYSAHHGPKETPPGVDLCAADAERLGLQAGELVRVGNQRGALELPVVISERVRPGVVAIPWGWWGEAANVNVLTDDTLTDAGGGVRYNDTYVTVSAVSAVSATG
jgi:anaerobic selenocysteine-containing dehydrogenase